MGIPIGKGCEPGGLSTCFEVIGHGNAHPSSETSNIRGTDTKGKIARALGLGNAV